MMRFALSDLARSVRPLLLAAALVSVAALPVLAQSTKQSGDHIVAVVNSELVTSVEVAQRAEQLRAEAQRQGRPTVNDDQLRQQALDSLIDERVQVTYARDTGYKVDEVELDRAVNAVAAQNRLSVPELRARLQSEGLDYGRFRKNLRDQILVERVREREVISRIRINEADVEAEMQRRRADVAGEVKLNLAQILIKVPEGATITEAAERRARIDAANARIRAGEDFAAVAREVSEDGNREQGGEMGLRPVDRLPDLFTKAVQGLKAGQVTPEPLRSGAGFHLLKVVERQADEAFAVKQTHVRHILLRVPEGSSPEAVAQRMNELREDIVAGRRSFGDVARALSEDATAQEGGDLGWVSAGQFVPEFETVMNGLSAGEVSRPVLSRFGMHLIEVIDRRSAEVDPQALREQVSNQMRSQQFEREYAEWVKELRLRAFIDLRENER